MSITQRVLRAGFILAALAVAIPAQGQGLGNWIFTPYVGAYVPTADLARVNLADASDFVNAKFKHDNAIALGGNLSYWFAERMGVEFGGAYAWSDAKASFSMGGSNLGNFAGSGGENAYVLMGAAKMMFALLPPTSQTQLRFGVGPAIVNRGGTAYKADEDGKFTGLTNVGGAASLCTRIPLAGRLALRLRAEDYFYQARLKFRDASSPTDNFNFDRRFQNDLIFSAGLQIGLAR